MAAVDLVRFLGTSFLSPVPCAFPIEKNQPQQTGQEDDSARNKTRLADLFRIPLCNATRNGAQQKSRRSRSSSTASRRKKEPITSTDGACWHPEHDRKPRIVRQWKNFLVCNFISFHRSPVLSQEAGFSADFGDEFETYCLLERVVIWRKRWKAAPERAASRGNHIDQILDAVFVGSSDAE